MKWQRLTSSFELVRAGGIQAKEILLNASRYFNKQGLGSYPKELEKVAPSLELKQCFVNEVGSYCAIVKKLAITQGMPYTQVYFTYNAHYIQVFF
jgi:hypothetical protein